MRLTDVSGLVCYSRERFPSIVSGMYRIWGGVDLSPPSKPVVPRAASYYILTVHFYSTTDVIQYRQNINKE